MSIRNLAEQWYQCFGKLRSKNVFHSRKAALFIWLEEPFRKSLLGFLVKNFWLVVWTAGVISGIKVAFGFKFLRRSLSGILSTKTGYTTFKCSLSFTSNSKLLSLFTWRASATWELKPGGHLKSGNLGLGVRAAFPTL